jgi:valacyclovir hydrolase
VPYFTNRGHDLFFREQGAGELLLILPGNTAASICHERELQYFSDRYHAVSLDFRGTGKSGRIPVWPDEWFEEGAHDAAALVNHLGYGNCHVMGTSGGAIVALLMAILYPERVKSVIADSTVEYFSYPSISKEVQERYQYTSEQTSFWQFVHGDDWKQVVEADSNLLLRLEKAGNSWVKNGLSKIQCPVLFSASLEDESVPNAGEQVLSMARKVNNCQVFFTNHGNHPLMWSKEKDFRNIADLFLKNQI